MWVWCCSLNTRPTFMRLLEEHVEAARGAELPAAELRRPSRVEGQAREPPDQRLDRDPDLGAGEGVPGAEMLARAEGQDRWAVRRAVPEDVEPVRVGELGLVPVGRRDQ